jgi:hypothetical protein
VCLSLALSLCAALAQDEPIPSSRFEPRGWETWTISDAQPPIFQPPVTELTLSLIGNPSQGSFSVLASEVSGVHVDFYDNGNSHRRENNPPYCLFGDDSSNCHLGAFPSNGDHTIEAYAVDNSTGDVVASATISITQSSSPNPPIEHGSGIKSSFFGQHINSTSNLASVNVPFGTLRMWDNSTSWAWICPDPSCSNWGKFDEWVAYAQANNIEVVYVLSPTYYRPVVWDNPSGTNVADLANWDNWVRLVVTHSAGKVKYWEIWNEPNNEFYDGTMSQLVTLAQHAYTIIKSIDPSAMVISPPPDFADADFLSEYFAAGGGQYMDIIGFHSYFGSVPEDIVTQMQIMQQVAASYGYSHLPIWDTEGSWGPIENPTDAELDWQANFLARDYILQASSGIVSRFIWYGWDFYPWGNLWDSNNGAHPAGQAYGTVYNWLVGATFTTPCSKIYGSVWMCELSRPGGYSAQIIWTADESQQVYSVPGQFVNQRNLLTNTGSPIQNNAVNIGPRPKLIENYLNE